MLARVGGLREAFEKLKFRLIWTGVGLAALIVLALIFWRALLGVGFIAVLLLAIWRTRERMGSVHALLALAALTVFALIFWRSWLIVAMVVAIGVLVLRATRMPKSIEEAQTR